MEGVYLNPCQKLVNDGFMDVLDECPNGRRSTSRPDMRRCCISCGIRLFLQWDLQTLGLGSPRGERILTLFRCCSAWFLLRSICGCWVSFLYSKSLQGLQSTGGICYFESYRNGSTRLPGFKLRPIREVSFSTI